MPPSSTTLSFEECHAILKGWENEGPVEVHNGIGKASSALPPKGLADGPYGFAAMSFAVGSVDERQYGFAATSLVQPTVTNPSPQGNITESAKLAKEINDVFLQEGSKLAAYPFNKFTHIFPFESRWYDFKNVNHNLVWISSLLNLNN